MGLAFEVMSHVRFGLAEDGTSIGLFGQSLVDVQSADFDVVIQKQEAAWRDVPLVPLPLFPSSFLIRP